MMRQEGLAAAFARREPTLQADDLAAIGDRLAPLRETRDFPVVFAALYGDEAAREVGHDPLGLPPLAGFELGIAEVLAAGLDPVAELT